MSRLLPLAMVIALLCADYCGAQPAAAATRQLRWLPDSVELIADIPYADTDNPRQRLDLVVPRNASDEPLPVVAFVHGGAWRAGDKRMGLRQVAPLAASGEYAVASIGYRLTDESQWPDQIHDCKAAIRWLRANADKHDLDGDRIGVWGASAGGHLVAVLGTSGDVAAMDGTLGPYADRSSRVACVVDFFGPTDFLAMSRTALESANFDHDGPRSPESLLIGGAIHDHQDKVATANPITYVSDDDPPFLIVHGTADPLVPYNQSELLHQSLQQVHVPTTVLTVEGGGHGQWFPKSVNQEVRRFFDDHLRGEKSNWEDTTVEAKQTAAP